MLTETLRSVLHYMADKLYNGSAIKADGRITKTSVTGIDVIISKAEFSAQVSPVNSYRGPWFVHMKFALRYPIINVKYCV
jgi:hypothetical protein